jgi:bacteriorhodopsin
MPLEALIQLSDGAVSFQDRPEVLWLALGSALMLIGGFYFVVKGWGVEDPKAKEYYAITIMIPMIAFASYIAMFFGFGLTEVTISTGETLDIYWARYADWLFTTPLLLADLGLLAGADPREIGGIVLVDGFMIVTGLVGALEKTFAFRFIWWFISTVSLVFILYFLYFSFTRAVQKQSEDAKDTFKVLRNLTVILWAIYPIWWLVGTEGAGAISLYIETLGFMVLDVSAKVGFGIILLRSRSVIGGSEAPEPSAGEAAAAD